MILSSRRVRIKRYIVEHHILEPSKMSDYDYDPRDIERRFYSTYMHRLIFLDSITEQQILNVTFSTEVCARMVSSLYGISCRLTSSSHPLDAPSENVMLLFTGFYLPMSNCPSKVVVTNIAGNTNLNVVGGDSIRIIIEPCEISDLIDLLETEELEDMYCM